MGQNEMAKNYRARFAYRIDMWDAEGENTMEHLAGVEDLQFAKAAYLAAWLHDVCKDSGQAQPIVKI